MPEQLFTNNLSNVVSAIDFQIGDLILPLTAGDSALFNQGIGAAASGDFQIVSITDGVSTEILKLVSISGDDITLQRAQENTVEALFVAGSIIFGSITKGSMEEIQANQLALEGNINTVQGNVNTLDNDHTALINNIDLKADNNAAAIVVNSTSASLNSLGIADINSNLLDSILTANGEVLVASDGKVVHS